MSCLVRCFKCPEGETELVKERKYQCQGCRYKAKCTINDPVVLSSITVVMLVCGALFLHIWGAYSKADGSGFFHIGGGCLELIGVAIIVQVARDHFVINPSEELTPLQKYVDDGFTSTNSRTTDDLV